MPSELLLLDFKGQLEAATKSVLIASGLEGVYTSRDREELSADWIQVSASLDERLDHMQQKLDGSWVEDSAMLTLEIVVSTQRPTEEDATQPRIQGAHADRVARIQQALSRTREALNTRERLPYHVVLRLDLTGIPHEVETDDASDASALSWAVMMAVQPEAWGAD